jgi:hypothetical protein
MNDLASFLTWLASEIARCELAMRTGQWRWSNGALYNELLTRLSAVDPAYAGYLEGPQLYSQPHWAGQKLQNLLVQLSPLATIPAPSATPAKQPRPRRRVTDKPRSIQPLTARQAETIQIVGEMKGNIAAAAKRLGRDRKTVEEAYRTGMTKLGKQVVRSRDKTRHLYRDARGQDDVASLDDMRAGSADPDHDEQARRYRHDRGRKSKHVSQYEDRD